MSESLLDPRDHDLERELMEAGRDVKLSAGAEARILASLGLAAGGLTAAGKAAASTGGALTKLSSALAGKTAVWATAGIVSVGAIGGGAWYVSRSNDGPVAPRVVEAPAAPVKKDRARADDARSAEEAPQASPDAEPRAPTPSKPRVPSTPERARERGTLGDELTVVESASRALRAGNPQAALGRLAEYRQRFPRGKLALEAQVLRIEALARAGQGAEAARLARGFLKRHPNSPIAARIRRYAE